MSSESASNDNASNGDDSETTVSIGLFLVRQPDSLIPQCQDYSTPASVPQSIPEFKTSTLHDTSRSKYHMKDLSSFASNLEKVIVRNMYENEILTCSSPLVELFRTASSQRPDTRRYKSFS